MGRNLSASHSRVRVAILAVTLGIALTATSLSSQATASARIGNPPLRSGQASVDWQPCGEGDECATLLVPLDYSHPRGRTIALALRRSPAMDPTRRIGSLLVNPGGPGVSGLELGRTLQAGARGIAGELGAEVAARYDFIGFDPRGVGESNGVRCSSDLDAYFSSDVTPDDRAERESLVKSIREYVAACKRESGAILPFVGTRNAARDLDRVRQAVGDERLFYLGYSYGTSLGTAYADQFPKRVGRLVLDGAIDPKLNGVQLVRQQARSLEESFDRFASECAANPSCPFQSGGDPAGAYDRLMAQLDAQALPAGNGRMLTASQAAGGIATALFNRADWPNIAEALAAAARGDGSRLLALFDEYEERSPDGTYTNVAAASNAVNCVDYRWPRGDAGYKALVTNIRAEAPRFGQAFAWEFLPCAYWGVSSSPTPKPKPVRTAPILVAGTTGDPATPYAWSEALAAALPDSVLLTRNGEGHTAYLTSNRCIDDAVNNYLLTGTPPPAGTTC